MSNDHSRSHARTGRPLRPGRPVKGGWAESPDRVYYALCEDGSRPDGTLKDPVDCLDEMGRTHQHTDAIGSLRTRPNRAA